MTLEPALMFSLANGLALMAWLALLASPARAPWASRVWQISGGFVPLVLSALYVAMLALHWRGEGGFGSIEAVRAMFDVPGVLVAGWTHYLAFDLFVGAWIARRCARLGIGHAWVMPLLLFTFMLGPLGLLAFALLRALRRPVNPKTTG